MFTSSQLKSLRREEQQLTTGIANLATAIESANSDLPTLVHRLTEREARLVEVQTEIRQLKTAGKQAGFDEYSETFRAAEFIWTPELLFLWLADIDGMFPETTMMSLDIPSPQARADLIAYLAQFK